MLHEALITARSESPRNQITAIHLEIAYRSASYSARRNDVELLASQRNIAKARKDLFSPMAARAPAGRNLVGAPQTSMDRSTAVRFGSGVPEHSTKIVSVDKAIRTFETRILDAMHEEQMQAPMRREVEKTRARRVTQAKTGVVVALRKEGSARKLADVIGSAAELIDDQ